MRLSPPAAALPLILAASPAMAGRPVNPFDEPDESELFRTEQELVTVASRYAQTVRQAPSIVTVVSAGDIRRSGFRTLSEVLGSLPGIYISVAKESRDLAWFRGVTSSDNNKILLLIDGVPWYDGVYGHAWIDEYLSLDQVRQVEVIKGPGSALYGTNAFAGVINVVTWDGRSLDGGFVRLKAGSDGRVGASAVFADDITVRGHALSVRAHARVLSADGDGLDTVPRGRRDVQGLDPKRAINGGMRLEFDGLSLAVDLVDYRHTYFVNEQDDVLDVLLNSPDEFALNYRNAFLAASYDVDLGPMGTVRPYLYSQRHDNPGLYGWFSNSAVEGDEAVWQTTLVETAKDSARHGVGVEASLVPAASHAVVTGVGLEAVHVLELEDRYFEDLSHEPSQPSTFSAPPGWITDAFLFGQYTWTASWWLELTAGARLDYHSYFGPFVSPRMGALFVPAESVLIKLLYGRAFRAPTARELLVEVGVDSTGANLFTNGNPGLEPEIIDTIEAELTVNPSRLIELRGAAFVSGIDQEINKSTVPDPVLGSEYYANLGGALAMGTEFEATFTSGAWEVDASYTWTEARDRETGNRIYAFPPHMAHGRIGVRPVEPLSLALLGDAYGVRPRSEWTPDSGLDDGPPYGLLHAAVAVDGIAGGRVTADLSVRNLLDTPTSILIPQEDANAVNSDGTAKYPVDIEGEGRTIQVDVEVRF
ncbi:MAG: TonB-dependent receptor [Deltaproteobacteria bacterium]|nr:MAG: TonB-dependent receptor [Deltaproteobacteria bacterium]